MAKSLLLIEMVFRVVKNEIREELRKRAGNYQVPLEEPYRLHLLVW